MLAVGHSYGGAVISNAATDAANVGGLVFVAAFAPERAGATITEAAGSHVIMVSQPATVADVIMTAATAVGDAARA